MALVRWLWSLPADVAAAIAAAVGLVCLVASPVAVVAAISIVGLPLAILMAVIPTLSLALVTWRITYRLLALAGLHSVLASAFLAALVLAVPAALCNGRLDARARGLVAGDLPDPSPLARGAVVGLQRAHVGRPVPCDDLCRRLLLTGTAARVLVAETPYEPGAPSAGRRAVGFRLATTGAVCPDTRNLLRGGATLRLPGDPPRPDTAELVRIAEVSGRCLLAEPARLADAQVLLSEGIVAKGGSDYAAGLSPGYDTVRARRISVHVARGSGWEEVHRQTRVTYDRLAPIIAPSYAFAGELQSRPALLRVRRHLGHAGPAGIDPDWPALLRDVLRVDLSVAALSGTASPARTLGEALGSGRSLSPAAAELATDLFGEVARQRKITPADAEVALAVLRDRRLPVSAQAWALPRYGQDLPPAVLAETGDILFARLRELADAPDKRSLQDAQPIAAAIDVLPDAVIRAHRADLDWLAAEPRLRIVAWGALRQLSVFGADAVPTLLALLDAGAERRLDGRSPTQEWQHPYLAGLAGLCRAGPAAAIAAPALLDRIAEGRLLLHASYGRLATSTLTRMGVSADTLRSALVAAGAKPEDVDRDLRHVQRRTDCGF